MDFLGDGILSGNENCLRNGLGDNVVGRYNLGESYCLHVW